MSSSGVTLGSVWLYVPNKGAAIFFAIAFLTMALVHAWQAFHYKSWRLTGLHVFCNALMLTGFITRAMGAWDYDNVIIYMVSIITCMAAPPLYELSNFYLLGRILYFVPYHSPIHPGRVLSTFAFLSFIVEALNGVGSAWVANVTLPANFQNIGAALIQASLIVQLAVILAFLTLATHFWVFRVRRAGGIRNAKIDECMYTLYASNVLILGRCLYRTVEYFHGASSVDLFDPATYAPENLHKIPRALRYEWYFLVFEASLMCLNTVLLAWRHPRRWLPKSTKVYLAKRDGVTEVMGPGYKEDRPFMVTLCDPFDFVGMVKGRDSKRRFWDEEDEQTTTEAEAGVKESTSEAGSPAVAGPSQRQGQQEKKKKTGRSWWIILLDPFDWLGLEKRS